MSGKGKLLISSSDLAHIFAINVNTLTKWRRIGAPQAERGKWDLSEFLPWWLENIYAASGEDADIGEIKKGYWRAKTRVEEVKAATLEEKYIPKEDVGDVLSYQSSVFRQTLLAFSSRLSIILVGKNEKEIREILFDEAWTVLATISKNIKYEVKEFKKDCFKCLGIEKKPKSTSGKLP